MIKKWVRIEKIGRSISMDKSCVSVMKDRKTERKKERIGSEEESNSVSKSLVKHLKKSSFGIG
jgi:hypothetical protein